MKWGYLKEIFKNVVKISYRYRLYCETTLKLKNTYYRVANIYVEPNVVV